MKAVIWPYRFKDMRVSWAKQFEWVVKGLQANDIEVVRHPDFFCSGLEELRTYSPSRDNPATFCVYNHASINELGDNSLKAKVNLFFKPTVPTETTSTLDILGYGPMSQFAFNRPDIEAVTSAQSDEFFAGPVKRWIDDRSTKWGDVFGKDADVPLPSKQYHLILGQCPHDSVVTQMAFGDYIHTLAQMVVEILRARPEPVVVKLHPYMQDKSKKGDKAMAKQLASTLTGICPSRVSVHYGHSSVHEFLPGARAVILSNSAAGYEAMMHGVPIISWGWPEYHWVCWQLHLISEMQHALNLGWFNRSLQDKFLCWYNTVYCFDSLAGAKRRIKTILGSLPADRLA